ncbi:MAG: hypothetical protein IT550_01890, partial [Novosphingobium sp.]|nr:hypothetical protein [Novosphingobium sp.]
VPAIYPASLRASGTGLAVGMGRVGAATGPMLGGMVLASGASVVIVTGIMTLPLLVCGILLGILGRRPSALADRPSS